MLVRNELRERILGLRMYSFLEVFSHRSRREAWMSLGAAGRARRAGAGRKLVGKKSTKSEEEGIDSPYIGPDSGVMVGAG